MAMKSYSPWWLSGILALGLAIIFAGERAFAHSGMASTLGWIGSLLVFGVVAYRGFVLTRTGGSQRKVEFYSVLCHLGIVLSLIGYYLTTESGISLLGMTDKATIVRWVMVMRVLWIIAFAVSAIPLVFVEASMGLERGHAKTVGKDGVDASVDVFQVREMASSGLSIALAMAFLMVTCNIAEQRNMRKDVSYFKTSSPGTATVNMVKSLPEPLQVMLFFPESSEVVLEVREYFKALADSTNLVELTEHDRLVESRLAEEHKVGKEGTIVLIRGEKVEKFVIETDIVKARKKVLREFDGTFQKSLMAVLRDPKRACFSVGHGELNDPKSGGPFAVENRQMRTSILKTLLKRMNYKVEDVDGFGKPIPAKCSVLLVLAPSATFDEAELAAVDTYLAEGGAAIISLDPDRKFRLDSLQGRLGMKFNAEPIADEREHAVTSNRSPSDNSLILTNQFLSHASISSLSRARAESRILFMKPGSFDKVEGEAGSRKVSEIIRSMKTSYRDLPNGEGDRNFTFDKESEARGQFPLVVAVEDPTAKPAKLPPESEHNGMRAILIADAEVFGDLVMQQSTGSQAMLVDIVKWTGGEEAFSGTTVTEKDKRIEHTKSQDAKWFYGTMVGAPLLMLGLGMLFVTRRRKRGQRRNK